MDHTFHTRHDFTPELGWAAFQLIGEFPPDGVRDGELECAAKALASPLARRSDLGKLLRTLEELRLVTRTGDATRLSGVGSALLKSVGRYEAGFCSAIATATVREMPLHREGKPNRKLVIFSDSRQDAAKLAAGVERDHFRDMVRLALLEALNRTWGQFRAAVKRAIGNNQESGDRLLAVNPELHTAVQGPTTPDEQRLAREWVNANNSRFNELRNLLDGLDPDNPDIGRQVIDLIERYPRYAALDDLCRTVRDELLRLGIGTRSFTASRVALSRSAAT